MNTVSVPVFPLGVVLFPGGVLPLRIFEPRYVAMVARCTRESEPFIVTLPHPDGGAYDIGTSARIVDFDQGEDGLLHIRCLGERRARLVPEGVQDDGLLLARVEWIGEIEGVPVPVRHERLAGVLGELISQLDVPIEGAPRLNDAGWVSGRFAELLPLEPAAKIHLLREDDPVARLDAIASLLPTLAD